MPTEVEKASILRQQIAEHLLENAVLCRCLALFQILEIVALSDRAVLSRLGFFCNSVITLSTPFCF